MKKIIHSGLIFLLCMLIAGVCVLEKANAKTLQDAGNTSKDDEMVRKTVMDVFNAYSSMNNTRIISALNKYINPDNYKKAIGDVDDSMNTITVDGTTIYKNGAGLGKNKLDLGDYDISIFPGSAIVKGFVEGRVLLPGKQVQKGPWNALCGLYKFKGSWFIEYIKLTKVNIIKLEYYTQLPEDFGRDKSKKWPLIVFLHGAGERGGKLDDVKKMNHSIPMVAATSQDFPFVAVSPLCPEFTSWRELPYSVSAVIDEVTSKYNIDTDRIYLTGLSIGGIGTWNIALQFPDKFAAIAPVCGSVDPKQVERLKKLPIWAFHGAKDAVVPIDDEKKAIDLLKACGGNIRYTVYPNVEHDAWNKAYTNKALYSWFLQHTREKNKK